MSGIEDILLHPGFIAFVLVTAGLVYVVGWNKYPLELWVFYYNKLRHRTKLTRKEFIRIHRFLAPHVKYYRRMNNRGKARFINRIIDVADTKRFIGKEGFEVTDEVRFIISAAIVQLTFGLDKYFLNKYTQVFIYPKEFQNPILDQTLKGGVDTKASIMLSWKHTVKSFEAENSRINVALHEMAHALKLEALIGKANTFDRKFMLYLNNWLKISDEEYRNMNQGAKSFLRKYGGTNRHEFFAVCVEHFFTVPNEFKEALPDIFNHLCFLLNQNPTNVSGNYALTKEFKEQVNQDENLIPLPRWVVKHRRRRWKKRYRWVRKQHLPKEPIAAQTMDDK